MEENVIANQNDDKKKNLIKKILVIVGNVVFYTVVILLFLFSLMNINAGNGTENFPNLFGRGFLSVESDSMTRREGGYHPAEWDTYEIKEINKGDLVYSNVFGGDLTTLKIGDVITFYDHHISALNTHRIVYISVEFGYVVTQGDLVISVGGQSDYYDATMTDKAKNDRLSSNSNLAQVVNTEDIKGVATGIKAGAGNTLSFIRDNWLFIFVVPIAIVLLFEVFLVVKNILDLRNEKNKVALESDKEAMMAELEAEKERMRQELLAELKAEQMSKASKEVEEETSEEESSSLPEDDKEE